MFAIGIRYLTGYAAATDLSTGTPEWPPHPGRVFMALAAAHYTTNAGETAIAAGRAALLWLESQPPPAIHVSSASHRSNVEAYVPVNDDAGVNEKRTKQLRTFRKTRPDSEFVHLLWSQAPPPEIERALRALCPGVTRIGYSASLTQVWVAGGENPPAPAEPNWLPDAALQSVRLRIPVAGTLANLEHSYNLAAITAFETLQNQLESAPKSGQTRIRKQIKQQFPLGPPQPERPTLHAWQGYREFQQGADSQSLLHGPFDPQLIILEKKEGCALGLESTQQLTAALRNSLMKPENSRPPEWLSGHAPSGEPSQQPHAAFFPIPYIGAAYADGHILGLAIALPRNLGFTAAGRAELRERLGNWLLKPDGTPQKQPLWNHAARWHWDVELATALSSRLNLQTRRWTGPSQVWASVTPVVLHHHPKREGHAAEILAQAIQSARYPMAESVELRTVSPFTGAGSVDDMPPFAHGGPGLCKYHVHAIIRFPRELEGPVLIGRGRYRGYGLFRPYKEVPL